MKISARNRLSGTVKSITRGPISTVVVLEIAPGIEVASTITTESANDLDLKEGQQAWALIKASSVMIGVD